MISLPTSSATPAAPVKQAPTSKQGMSIHPKIYDPMRAQRETFAANIFSGSIFS